MGPANANNGLGNIYVVIVVDFSGVVSVGFSIYLRALVFFSYRDVTYFTICLRVDLVACSLQYAALCRTPRSPFRFSFAVFQLCLPFISPVLSVFLQLLFGLLSIPWIACGCHQYHPV